jgi:hypothetical protein
MVKTKHGLSCIRQEQPLGLGENGLNNGNSRGLQMTTTHSPSCGCDCSVFRWDSSSPKPHFFGVLGQTRKNLPGEGRFSPNCREGGLAFPSRFAIIQSTYSPCRSRSAVTHIKGEFFYWWTPPSLRMEEPR